MKRVGVGSSVASEDRRVTSLAKDPTVNSYMFNGVTLRSRTFDQTAIPVVDGGSSPMPIDGASGLSRLHAALLSGLNYWRADLGIFFRW